jgi:XTP/dITP diphosphohydrolase
MTPPIDRLVLGTKNRKKAAELLDLLAPLGLRLETLAEHPQAPDVEESGDTFVANARLKAAGQALALSAWVLGEDSGIVVDALGGAPGVYSARYSGPGATDASNNALLLEELGRTPLEKRTAHYVCQLSLADPTGAIRQEQAGKCHGRIRFAPAGSGGFGYDPLFEIVEYHHTFGELGEAVKGLLSHRARAIEALLPELRKLLATAGDLPRAMR